jgi:uncharacterized paraquat-inducible protein A
MNMTVDSALGKRVQVQAARECPVCRNINPPHAKNYCVKCGNKLE